MFFETAIFLLLESGGWGIYKLFEQLKGLSKIYELFISKIDSIYLKRKKRKARIREANLYTTLKSV